MTNWTKENLLELDAKYAEQGIRLHQRPLRAAADLLGSSFVIGLGSVAVAEIVDAYRELIPEVSSTWPGSGIGIAASVDRVRKVTLPVIYGSPPPIQVWQVLGFQNVKEWWDWCRQDLDIAAGTSFACADMHDLSYGLDEIPSKSPAAVELWGMARSNLEDVANVMPTTFSVDSVIQPVCLVVELAIKACLVCHGADPKSFKGKDGHNVVALANQLQTAAPHRDDSLVALVASKLPPYVASRYAPQGLTRIQVVRLALGAQFIAASTLRRVTKCDLAAQMENGGWPAPRPSLFPPSP